MQIRQGKPGRSEDSHSVRKTRIIPRNPVDCIRCCDDPHAGIISSSLSDREHSEDKERVLVDVHKILSRISGRIQSVSYFIPDLVYDPTGTYGQPIKGAIYEVDVLDICVRNTVSTSLVWRTPDPVTWLW